MNIGVTGLYCAGKSAVSAALKEYGFYLIPVDTLGHQVLAEKKDDIVKQFGRGILDQKGDVCRKKLGALVFGDSDTMRELESIVHPAMKAYCRNLRDEHGKEHREVVIDAALLFYMGLDDLCDLVIEVKAPWILRFLRAKRRDKLGYNKILQRFYSQKKLSVKNMTVSVDTYTIHNWRTIKNLHRQVKKVLKLHNESVGGTGIRTWNKKR